MPRAGRPARELVSATERRILFGIAAGKTNRAIGSDLGIAEETVKSHVRKMLRRFGAQDRASLLYAAIRRDIIPVVDLELPPPVCYTDGARVVTQRGGGNT